MNRGTSRRKFIQVSGTIAAGMALPSIFGLPSFGQNPIEETDIKSLFKSNRDDALILTDRIFQKCILERILPPTPPLQHNWVYPGGPYYKGQWIWDTMFVVDLLSILPGKEKVIRDIFQIASGLSAYGHTRLADIIADKTVENAIANGISEHYDSLTGKPLGIPDYCMSASIATLMLDGLTKKYKLFLR